MDRSTKAGRGLLPPWPVLPPRLWATAGVAALALASLVFGHELWSSPRHAEPVGVAVFLLALVAAGPQVALVLWGWPAAYAGPRWLGVVFTLAARGGALGLLVLETVCCLSALIFLAVWAHGR